MKKNKINLINVTENVVNVYRNTVKNNKNDSIELIRKKLTRNIMCSVFIHKQNRYDVYGYGCLRIYVNSNNTVEYIRNHCEPTPINRKLKEKLDKELGIVKISLVDKIKNLLKVG